MNRKLGGSGGAVNRRGGSIDPSGLESGGFEKITRDLVSQRIVIYSSASWQADDRVVAAIERVAGEGSAGRLAEPGPYVALEDLEEAGARELFDLLLGSGADVEIEPMRLDEGQERFLAAELPKWVRRGLLHAASVPLIQKNYGIEPLPEAATPVVASSAASRPSVGSGTLLRAILALGATLVGLGLILFIAANWQRISPPVRIAGTLGITLALLHAGYRFWCVKREKKALGATLLLIALFGIGGVVILIGQTYHVEAESYSLPLIWGALAVPVALLLRFPLALWLSAGLWFWANGLFVVARDEASWFYPAILLGFLVPYALATGAKRLHVVNLAGLMGALAMGVWSQSFWQASLVVAGLCVLRWRLRHSVYDWLLMAGFALWNLQFVEAFEAIPNLIYLLPLGYFAYRSISSRSNALMAATVVNASIWLPAQLAQLAEILDLASASLAEGVLWCVALGVLWFGLGVRLRDAANWGGLSKFLRLAGGVVGGVAAYSLSFDWYAESEPFFDSGLFRGATALCWLAGAYLATPGVNRELRGRRWGLPLILALVSIELILALLTARDLSIHVVLFNVILFAAALEMMLRGHRSQSLLWFNGGIALFVGLIVTRYLDSFAEYLPRSVFFVLGGLFLIAWAVVADRQRRLRGTEAEDG